MADDHPLDAARASAALSRHVFTDSGSLNDALQHIATLACWVIPGCGSASLTMWARGEGPTTVAFTDDTDLELDQAQYDARTGPCLEAIKTARVLRVDSIEEDPRWSKFSHAALEHGVRSSLSLPLLVGEDAVGALNLYGEVESAFDDDDEGVGMSFAEQAAVAVANVGAYWSAFEETRHLHLAMESRATIEQAKGILMGRQGCSADKAFDMLRRASQRENRKLNVIASEIVERAAHVQEGTG